MPNMAPCSLVLSTSPSLFPCLLPPTRHTQTTKAGFQFPALRLLPSPGIPCLDGLPDSFLDRVLFYVEPGSACHLLRRIPL